MMNAAAETKHAERTYGFAIYDTGNLERQFSLHFRDSGI